MYISKLIPVLITKSVNFFQDESERSLCKLTFKSKRPKANNERTDNCKIGFRQEATRQSKERNED
jgi:hypothetical protein